MFVGTGDGNLLVCECRMDNAQQYTCSSTNVVRKSKERKAVYSALRIYESWRIIVGIMDGIITAYDTHTCQCISQLLDSKNCTLFSVHEGSSTMAVANKRKVSLYLWQGSGFVPQREIALNETPKFLHTMSGVLIIGYRKSYEVLNLVTYTSTHLLDVDKEHSMVGADIPASLRRGACVLLSVGAHGLLMENIKNRPTQLRERVEWTAPPLSIRVTTPYNLLSLLSTNVLEVHDLASLNILQTISLTESLGGISWTSGSSTASIALCKARKAEEHVFISSGEKIAAYTMIPVPNQIMSLTADGYYEEALELYNLCPKEGSVLEVQIGKVHAMYAHVLHGKGDFEGAVHNFVAAQSNPAAVLSLFPEFVPVAYHTFCKAAAAQSTAFVKAAAKLDAGDARAALTGTVLARAAAAVAAFCEQHRDATSNRAACAEKAKTAGIGAKIETKNTTMDSGDAAVSAEDQITMAELIDSTLLTCYVNSSPPRVETVVSMLSKPNRCNSESSAVLLASRGKNFMESLLWLYRSNGEHRRVLAALTEERCVDSGAWSLEQFHTWVAEYLCWLWFHEDPALPPLALQSLRQVLEYDADLGMGVLILRPKGCVFYGGKGVTVNEVINFLGSIKLPLDTETRKAVIAECKPQALPRSGSKKAARVARSHRRAHVCGNIVTPLINGAALGVSYLEWFLSTGAATAQIQDEFAQLLVKSIPLQGQEVDHSKNDLVIVEGEDENISLYKIYRLKLQAFLQSATEYHPDRIAKILPPAFLHEHALLLSSQGKHEDVITLYINRLKDLELATSYCDRIYHRKKVLSSASAAASTTLPSSADEDNAYLSLFRVLFAADECVHDKQESASDASLPTKERNLRCVMRVAEKYYERFSPPAFLNMINAKIPLAQVAPYLNIVMEYTNAKKKNLNILHQIMRMREVSLRTD